MRHRPVPFLLLVSILALGGTTGTHLADPEPSVEAWEMPRLAVCWADGTDAGRIPDFLVPWVTTQGAQYNFDDQNRWSATATDGGGLGQGDPITLTWGLVPDGTLVILDGGGGSDTLGISDLIETMDGIYGPGPGGDDLTQRPWFSIFQETLAWWDDAIGVQYVYEPNDDGARYPSSPGALGVRPDVRISGISVDGPFGILAFNLFPNAGDMVLDTDETASFLTGNDSHEFRNTIAHEHGHGLGIAHSCPEDRTKLMEPTAGFGFTGPQIDDILAGNRGYGDRLETPLENDAPGAATDLGAFSPGDSLTLTGLGIDGAADQDFFAMTLPARMRITLTMTPTGATYWYGPQRYHPDSGWYCDLGDGPLNTSIQNDLAIDLRGPSGTDILTSANFRPVGKEEAISEFLITGGEGTYYARVYGDALTDEAQMYDFRVKVSGGTPPVALCRNVSSCNGNIGPARLNGGSYDPDDDPLTLLVDPPAPYPPGETVVRIIVDDEVYADTCEATVTVNEPPVVSCRNVFVDSAGVSGADVLPEEVDDGSFDPEAQELALDLEPPGPYGNGVTQVLLIGTDPCGAADTCEAMVTVGEPVPVKLLSFTATRRASAVEVAWEISEPEGLLGFHVHREASGAAREKLTPHLLSGSGRYRFVDQNPPREQASYWLEERSRSGMISTWHGPVRVEGASLALPAVMLAAHPNPFAAATTITYSLAENRTVLLSIHDLQGRRVRVLVDGMGTEGEHRETWDGRMDNGAPAASGLYLLRLVAGDEVRIKKVVLSR